MRIYDHDGEQRLRAALATAQAERDEWHREYADTKAAAEIAAIAQGEQIGLLKAERDAALQRSEQAEHAAQFDLAQAKSRHEADVATIQRVMRERDAARNALERRQHQKGCPSLGIGGAVERNCTCGVNALRAELTAARRLLATRVEADRLSEANDEIARLGGALTEARRVLESALPHVGRLWHGPDGPPPAYIEELRARIAAVLAQEEAK